MNSNELTVDDVKSILDKQSKYFDSQVTKDIDFRIKQLN